MNATTAREATLRWTPCTGVESLDMCRPDWAMHGYSVSSDSFGSHIACMHWFWSSSFSESYHHNPIIVIMKHQDSPTSVLLTDHCLQL